MPSNVTTGYVCSTGYSQVMLLSGMFVLPEYSWCNVTTGYSRVMLLTCKTLPGILDTIGYSTHHVELG